MDYNRSLLGVMDEDKIENTFNDRYELRILSWNLQNPSFDRVIKQWKYIKQSNANVLILTEIKKGKGWNHLLELLVGNNFSVFYDHNGDEKDYFTVVAVLGYESKEMKMHGVLSQRIVGVNIFFSLGSISIIGMYAPSHGGIYATDDKIKVKRSFHDNFICYLKEYFEGPSIRLVVSGDLNILEMNHKPYQSTFTMWDYVHNSFLDNCMFDAFRCKNTANEHSWVSHQGIGQRLDHSFVDERLVNSIQKCWYDHKPRKNKISDHSVMFLELFSDAI